MSARPRHSRKEIRDFADELDRGGWVYESTDSSGHTVWSHPRASGTYKLPETPHHFNLHAARRDVAKLLGQVVRGKRSKKGKPKRQRQDFVLGQAKRSTPAAAPPPLVRRPPKGLPWEGAAADDRYSHAIDRLMREVPGGRAS